MKPSTTVLITNYNYGRYLPEAIESVLCQSVQVSELICVDDGSTDHSREVLSRYGSQVHSIFLENGGQFLAIAEGIKHAKGDIVLFLDADDKWNDCHCEKVTEAFMEDSSVGFVSTGMACFGDQGGGRHPLMKYYLPGKYPSTRQLVYRKKHFLGMPTSACAMGRNCAGELLNLTKDLSQTFRLCADEVLVYGSSLLGTTKVLLPWQTALYRIHGKNNFFDGGIGLSVEDARRRDNLLGILRERMCFEVSRWALREEALNCSSMEIYKRYYRRLIRKSGGRLSAWLCQRRVQRKILETSAKSACEV